MAKLKSGLSKCLVVTVILLLFANFTYAQPGLPPKSITVTATQPIEFGAFVPTGSGGTIEVDFNGVRTAFGGVVLVEASICKPAIFEVKLCPGRKVTISYAPSITISNGSGGSLTLNIGPTEMGVSGSYFMVTTDCNFVTNFRVGGTLIIPPGVVPTGFYTGVFDITFTQE